MATITAAANGNWNAGATWTGGAVPTISDIADINGKTVTQPAGYEILIHRIIGSSGAVVLNGNVRFNGTLADPGIRIGTGLSIYRSASGTPYRYKMYASATNYPWYITMDRVYPDSRVIDLSGYYFANFKPTISCVGSTGKPATGTMDFLPNVLPPAGVDYNGDYWLGVSSPPTPNNSLQAGSVSGGGEAYSRFDRAEATSLTFTAKWPKEISIGSLDYAEHLRRLVRNPYTVLVATPYAVIRGRIESVAYNERLQGGRHHVANITVVEGMY